MNSQMSSLDAPVRCAGGESLNAFLRNWASDGEGRTTLAAAVAALADAGVALSRIIAGGPLSGPMDAEIGETNADGDRQRKLDLVADQLIMDALRKSIGEDARLGKKPPKIEKEPQTRKIGLVKPQSKTPAKRKSA